MASVCLGKWHPVLATRGRCTGGAGIPVGHRHQGSWWHSWFPVILLTNRYFACFREFHILRTQRHCLQFITPWRGARFLTGTCGMRNPNLLLVLGAAPLREATLMGIKVEPPQPAVPDRKSKERECLPMCCSAPYLGKPWVSFRLPQNTFPAKLARREKSGSL